MIVNVAKIFLRPLAEMRNAAAVQLADSLHQRRDHVLQRHQLALDAVEFLQLVARRCAGEKLVLRCLEPRLELVEDGEIAVDDIVDQRIEHEARAVAQQLGLALGARAHAGEAELRTVPDRQHVIDADKDVDLADAQLVAAILAADDLGRMQHGEQRVAVFLDLRPLVTLARILDGELVEVELARDLVELALRRLEHRHPDEAVGTMHVLAHVGDGNVGDLPAIFVGDAADEHDPQRRSNGRHHNGCAAPRRAGRRQVRWPRTSLSPRQPPR